MARKRSAEQTKRNLAIAVDRSKGYTWQTIAARHEISARRAQQIVRESPLNSELDEPERAELLAEALESLDRAIEEYTEIADSTTNDSVKLGDLNQKVRTIERRTKLLRETGVLPDTLHYFAFETALANHVDALEEAFELVGENYLPGVTKALFEEFLRVSQSPKALRAHREREEAESRLKERRGMRVVAEMERFAQRLVEEEVVARREAIARAQASYVEARTGPGEQAL